MDTITHTLLGAACGYALFHRRLGRTAAAVGALAGAFPDIDVFIRSSTDPLLTVEFHRHFTHALPFVPIGAFVVAAIWILRAPWRKEWRTLWACAALGYLSHCLLDASTSYGTVLLWPFSRERFGWDWISIIDFAFTLPLLALLIAGLRKQRPGYARVAVAWCISYVALGGLQHWRGSKVQEELARQRGHVIDRREVMPTLLNNVVWRSLYLADGHIYSDRIRVGWFGPGTVKTGTHLAVVTRDTLTEAERARDRDAVQFQRFAWFTEGWVARSPVDPDVLGDMRYSLSTKAFDPVWGIRYTSTDIPMPVEWVNRSRQRKIDRQEFWSEIAGQADGYHAISCAEIERAH